MAVEKEALFWEKHKKGVKCLLCPNYCIIPKKLSGKCRKRINVNNKLYAENYAKSITMFLDPMEKKPLYHFYPLTHILSLGPNSCNLSCKFCQNHYSSMQDCLASEITPEELLNQCLKSNVKHVAFTYTEPITWFEYILDSAKLLKENGISVVLVTNGYINEQPLEMLIPHISAMNIDLKAFSDEFYTEICQGKLQPVLDVIRYAADKTHVELTFLMIETLNDDPEELEGLFSFVKDVNPEIPLHISKYFPRYQLFIEETNEEHLVEIAKKASKYLKYVYIGNFFHSEFQNTHCPECHHLLIDRLTRTINIKNGCCEKCNAKIPVVLNP